LHKSANSPTVAPAKTAATPARLWTRDLVLIILVNLCVFTNHIMSLSTFPFYIKSLGGTEAAAGMCAAAFSLVAVVARPFVGWWLDNGARRVVLVTGLVLMGLAPLGYVFVPALSAAIAIRMLHGVGLSLSNSTTATVASDVICRPRFAEGMGYFGMATALASAIAPALGLSLMEGLGFKALYAAAAAIAAAGLVLFSLVRAPRPSVPRKPLDLRTIINRDALPATVTMLVFMFTFGALENFVAIFAAQRSLPSGSIYFLVMSAMLLLVRSHAGQARGPARRGVLCVHVQRGDARGVSAACDGAQRRDVRGPPRRSPVTRLAGWSRRCSPWQVHTATSQTRGSANSTFLCGYDIGYGLGGGVAGALITGVGYSAMWATMSLACVASVAVYIAWARKSDTSFSKALSGR
jgi:MFS family permease